MSDNQLDLYLKKNPFNRPMFPRILSYSPNIINKNEYVFSIHDVEVTAVTKIEVKLTLPEIKGIGKVAYIRDYPFLLIKKFDILIKNPIDEVPKIYKTLDGEDLCSRFKLTNNRQTYFNMFGGENDKYCSIKEGTFLDCVIFPAREITIPVYLSNYCCYLYPTTEIELRVTLCDLQDIISYNSVFHDKSLFYAVQEFQTTSKNLKLNFTNTLLDINKVCKYPIQIYRNDKTTCLENGADTIVSNRFKTAKHVSVYNKCNIFNETGMKFIIPFGPSLREKDLINIKDLIIVTEKDLTRDSVKSELGYPTSTEFKEIDDNRIDFINNLRRHCQIYINNIPEDCKIYYHTNILSFTRRHENAQTINISELFYSIKGDYYEDGKISFLMDEIKHDIEIYHVNIPVNIWNDRTNTSSGDLRSEASKEDDFYYKNRFIYGMDILSKDTGIDKVSLTVGREYLTQSYQTTYENQFLLRKADFTEYYSDENVYLNRCEFFTSHIDENHYINADENINFNAIITDIDWKKYLASDPVSLYKKRPTIVVVKVYNIFYDGAGSHVEIVEK